jgi:hypothetical protein
MATITNLEDNVRINYSTDWLPPYIELRTELVNEYHLQERRRAEEGKKHKGGHPVLPILQEHEQPGPKQRARYGCGQKGDHMRGDPKCPAGLNAIWDGAPEVWKERVRKCAGGQKGKGKGKWKPGQRNFGKRGGPITGQPLAKTPCPNWIRGNGFCKYGNNCRYSHDGPKAANKKRKNELVFLTTKKGKKARKQLSSLLMKDIRDSSNKSGDDKYNKEDDHLYQLIRGVPFILISRGGNDVDYKPRRPNYTTDDDSDNDDKFPPLTKREEEMLTNLYNATNKYEAAIAMQPEAARLDKRSHAWKEKQHVDFTVTLTILAGSPDPNLDESTGEEENQSDADSLMDEKNTPCPNWSSRDGFCRFGTNCKYSHDGPKGGEGGSTSGDSTDSEEPKTDQNKEKSSKGQSNLFSRENSNLGQSNLNLREGSNNAQAWMDEMALQDEKISHLKEQIMMWKIRASSAEERVTRLLQMREREIKESHEMRLKSENEKEEQGSSSVQDDSLPPEITHVRKAGRRARLSDTLALLTDPKWEADPDPGAEWIVLKIPKGNDSYFLADFVDGDKEDEKEWLESPFQQRWSVDYLVGLKRMQRSERRERSNYLRANEGKSMGRKKMTRRKEVGSVESMRRSIAPNTTQWQDLRADPEERYAAAMAKLSGSGIPHRIRR